MVNIAEKMNPEQNVEKLPNGEILNSSLIFIEVVFLNLGGFLFVKSIGIRAMENNISIDVNLANSSPIGVDTKEDYLEIKKLMEYKN